MSLNVYRYGRLNPKLYTVSGSTITIHVPGYYEITTGSLTWN